MEPNRIVFEAIARKRCLRAIYNKDAVLLQPHIVYTRHGEVYVDAITVERDRKPPRELKLGSFKLAGLRQIEPTPREFEPSQLFEPASDRYAGVTLFAI